MRRVAALLLAASLSTGCVVVALRPLYDDESVVFDERLLGQWENIDDRTAATIERAEWQSYRVSYTDHSATTVFSGNLTRVGEALFLDLTESRGVDPGPFLIPVHGLYRIELAADTLTAAPLDYQWFARAPALRTAPPISAALDGRRNVVIAASTRGLRTWIAHAPDRAFGVPMTFTRKR